MTLIAMMLRSFLYLKIAFSIGSDSFSAKWLTSSHSGIYIQVLCLFIILCKDFIISYGCNFIWRFSLVRKKCLNSFPRLLSTISFLFKIRTNLLIPYIRRYCLTLAINFSKTFPYYDLRIKLIKRGKKRATLSDIWPRDINFNMYLLFIFHTQINRNCKKCIIILITSIFSQYTSMSFKRFLKVF